MQKFLIFFAFLWSFALGVILAVIMLGLDAPQVKHRTSFETRYDKWYASNGLHRKHYPMDVVRYSPRLGDISEAEYLRRKIRVLCVMLVKKEKNARAANNTWMNSCDGRMFVRLEAKKARKVKLPIQHVKKGSSWHLLCDGVRRMDRRTFDWALFLYDDTFGVVENVRYMVAGLDARRGHYLGHAVEFWGTVYNEAQSGYVLSRGSVQTLQARFNSSEACLAGGRFWQQEDYYLGRHLAAADITPADTRDTAGLTTFHGHNVAQLLFPGGLTTFSNHYKRSVHPVKCCSPHSVTFNTIEADKMYTNHYLLYTLQVFRHGGHLGNVPASTPLPPDEVWKSFVRQRGVQHPDSVSADRYFQLWQDLVQDPVHFNQNIRNLSSP